MRQQGTGCSVYLSRKNDDPAGGLDLLSSSGISAHASHTHDAIVTLWFMTGSRGQRDHSSLLRRSQPVT